MAGKDMVERITMRNAQVYTAGRRLGGVSPKMVL
jgi:hypothetical protein